MSTGSMFREQLSGPGVSSPPPVPSEGEPGQVWRKSLVGKVAFGIGNCIQFVLMGLVLDLLLFNGVNINPGLKLVVLAFLIFGIAKKQAWLLLVAVQCALMLRDVKSTSFMLTVLSYIYALSVLVLLLFTFRLEKYSERISAFIANRVVESVGGARADRTSRRVVTPEVLMVSLGKIALRLLGLTAILFLATILIRYLPFAIGRQRELLASARASESMMWPGSGVLVFALGIYLVIREFFWRRATLLQATMFMRGLHLREHNTEIGSIIRRRRKVEQKKKRQAQKRRKKR